MTDRYFTKQTFAFLSVLAENNEREQLLGSGSH